MKQSNDELRNLSSCELTAFFADGDSLGEHEALALLEDPNSGAHICQVIAQSPRLTAFYAVRLRLVRHPGTALTHSVKFVHYLFWPDLLRLSVDVRIPAQVRHAVETQLLLRVNRLSLGEKISSAKRCSSALIRVFLFDPDPRVFAGLLLNQRLCEEDLLLLAGSEHATAEKLQVLASDRKWSFRHAIRRALVLNPRTPRSCAASQLRFLSQRDLCLLHEHPATSTYLRRCIERLRMTVFVRMAADEPRDQLTEMRDQEHGSRDF